MINRIFTTAKIVFGDPVLKTKGDFMFTNFKVSNMAFMIPCFACNELAQTICQNCVENDVVYVDGKLIRDKWTDKKGETRYTYKIYVKHFYLISKKYSDEYERFMRERRKITEDRGKDTTFTPNQAVWGD